MYNIKLKIIIVFEIILVFLLVFGIYSRPKTLSLSNFYLSSRLIRTPPEQSYPHDHEEKITIVPENAPAQEGKIRVDVMPDGELRIQIAKPSQVVDAKVEYKHSLKNANHFMEIFLTVATLWQYRAGEIVLFIHDWLPDLENNKREDWNLLRILKLFCDKIIIPGYNNNQPLRIKQPKQYSKVNISGRTPIEKILYIQDRFKHMAEVEVANTLTDPQATAAQIGVEKIADAHWKVNLPKGIRGKNIALIHSTEDADNFIKGLLAIFALRQSQIKSVFSILGYLYGTRQDQPHEPGQGITAHSVLMILHKLLSNILATSLHYGGPTRMVSLPEKNRIIRDENGKWLKDLPAKRVYNLNGVVPLAENIFDKIIEDLKQLHGDYPSAMVEFLKHPIIVVSPDDGGFKPAEEAAKVLKTHYIIKRSKEKYGIEVKPEDINILVGYLEKKRVTPGEVTIEPGSGILTEVEGKTKLLEIPTTLDDCWIIFLDDEISTGGTTLNGIWYLVEKLKADWSRIYSGGVHGKFTEGLENFHTGLSQEQLLTFNFPPEGIDEYRKIIAPKYLVVSNSYALRYDITPYPNIKEMSIQRLITFAIKKILGRPTTIEEP